MTPTDPAAATNPKPMDRAAGHNLVAKARLALLWTGGTAIITQASSWALTLWTARILDPTDYGIVAMIPIGFPLGNFGPVRRQPVREVTHFEKWG